MQQKQIVEKRCSTNKAYFEPSEKLYEKTEEDKQTVFLL